MRFRLLSLSLLMITGAALAAPPAARAPAQATAKVLTKIAPKTETGDRVVDGAALGAIERAVQRLSAVARAQAGTSQEPILMVRLAETQQKAASIRFRVERGKQDAQLYRKQYSASIDTLNQVIQRFPQHAVIPRAVFLRGRAFAEIDRGEEAIADFEAVVLQYPRSPDTISAAIYGYDVASAKQQYARGIQLLLKVQVAPDSAAYPLMMERLSWAYYATMDYDRALAYLSRWAASAVAREQDRVRKNASLYLATALEMQPEKYPIEAAYKYFGSLKLPRPELGDVCVQYAYLIRAKGKDAELERWTTLPAWKILPPAHQLDLLAINLGNQLNRKRFAEIDKVLDGMRAVLAAGYDPFQEKVEGNRIARLVREVNEAVAILASAGVHFAGPLMKSYGILIAFARDEERLTKLYFNLAESAFSAKEFEIATDAYGKLIAQYGRNPLAAGARLKRLAARFEALRKDGVLLRDLDVFARGTARETPIHPAAVEWLAWLDQALKAGIPPAAVADVDVYRLEAVRLIYASGRIDEALGRALAIATDSATSKQATAAWTLVQDTLIAGKEWDAGYQSAHQLIATAGTGGRPALPAELRKQVETFAEQSAFKRLEGLYADQQYAKVLEGMNAYIKEFPRGSQRDAALNLSANSALALKHKGLALKYFAAGTAATRSDPRVTLTEAAVAEESYDFVTAARKYVEFLSLPEAKTAAAGDRAGLPQRALRLAWMSGNTAFFTKEILPARPICGGPAAAAWKQDCVFFSALAGGPRNAQTPGALVFALAELRDTAKLAPAERLRVINDAIASWSALDDEKRLIMIPQLLARLPSVMLEWPNALRSRSAISLKTPAGIGARSQGIAELEKFAPIVFGVPSLQLTAAYELALSEIYREFAFDLKSMLVVPGLTGEALAAHQATVQGVIDATDVKAKALLTRAVARAREGGLQGDLPRRLEKLAQAGIPPFVGLPDVMPWVKALPLSGEDQPLAGAFARAAEKKNWDTFAYLLKELKGKSRVGSEWASAGEALWLAHTQRYPEGMIQLAQTRLPGDLSRVYAKFAASATRVPSSAQPAAQPPGEGSQ